MQFKKIGDIQVPAIGQGTGKIKDENLIRLGIDQGLTLIDTAESYGNEEIIGRAIKGKRDKVFISTKFSPEHNSYNDVIKACEGSLKRLDTDYIDFYSMHYPNSNIFLGGTFNALLHLKSEGTIRHLGYCNTNNVKGADFVQHEYNLFERSIEKDILPYCETNDILTMAYSPLQDIDYLNPDSMVWLQEIAFNHGVTRQQVILNWLISHKPVVVIPRSNNPKHIIQNSKASDFQLTPDEIQKISDLFPYQVSYIEPKLINIALSADKYPQTKEQAMNNPKWVVKPQDVDIIDFKPLKVILTWENTYEVLDDGFRYWAWNIQKPDEPVPCIIKKRWMV